MIAKKNRSIRYLTRQNIADIHADLSEQVLSDGASPFRTFGMANMRPSTPYRVACAIARVFSPLSPLRILHSYCTHHV